jgi:glycosidase
MPAWPVAPRVYEINTRVWLAELASRAGRALTLADVPESELAVVAARGFDAVWLMGVWTSGSAPTAAARRPDLLDEWRRALPDAAREDVVASPYAISAYDVSPTLGGNAALASLRTRLAQRGLRLVLDFVPNHTAADHPFVRERPEVYVHGIDADVARDPTSFFRTDAGIVLAHGRDPYFPAWTDTVQIDYGHAEGRRAMGDVLLGVAEKCDGVRCDMAMLVLPDVIERVWGARLGEGFIRDSFWKEAIASVRARHADFVFIAEAYWDLEPRLQAEGFDFTYDKSLYDRLHEGNAAGVRGHLARPLAMQRRDARFTENHDEPRAAQALAGRAKAAAALTYLSPGLKLFHEGQIEGRRVKLPVQLGRRPVEPIDAGLQAFYQQLLAILREPAFGDADFALVDVRPAGSGDDSHAQMVAFFRRSDRAATNEMGWLVIANIGDRRAYARVRVPLPFAPDRQYRFDDRLNGPLYDRDGRELVDPGLFVALDGDAAHVFCIEPR